MNKEELIEFIKEKGWDEHLEGDLEEMELQEIIDVLVDEILPECHDLHSEVKDVDYSDLHSEETMEEYHEHEDPKKD